MLPIGKQVTNQELSQRLKELGVKQESVWYLNNEYDGLGHLILKVETERDENCDWGISAFTVAELGRLLPDHFEKDKTLSHLEMGKINDNVWEVAYAELGERCDCAFEDTEANARAKALIWLIENEHVTA